MRNACLCPKSGGSIASASEGKGRMPRHGVGRGSRPCGGAASVAIPAYPTPITHESPPDPHQEGIRDVSRHHGYQMEARNSGVGIGAIRSISSKVSEVSFWKPRSPLALQDPRTSVKL